jgi:hypothetical protein
MVSIGVLQRSALKWQTLRVNVQIGTRAEAIQLAVKENASHGLTLDYDDKKRAITLVLKELPGMSDRALAELCRASHTWVSKVRAQLATVASSPSTRTGKDNRRRRLPERKPTKSATADSQTGKAVSKKPSSAQKEVPQTSPVNTREEKNPELREPPAEETPNAYDLSKHLDFLRDTLGREIERCPVEFRNKMIDDIVQFVECQRPEIE